MNWISVEDMMPGKPKHGNKPMVVLILFKRYSSLKASEVRGEKICMASFREGVDGCGSVCEKPYWLSDTCDMRYIPHTHVSHWMPLPDKP